MELYRDLGRFFIHESPRRFYVKCACIQKGHLSLCGPRKREPSRIPMASSALVFRPKNACPRALHKGRPRMEIPPCMAQEKWISTQLKMRHSVKGINRELIHGWKMMVFGPQAPRSWAFSIEYLSIFPWPYMGAFSSEAFLLEGLWDMHT